MAMRTFIFILSLLGVSQWGSTLVPATSNAGQFVNSNDICELQGSVFVENHPSFADYRVFVEETETFGKLKVFREEAEAFANKPGYWYFTDTRGFADFSIFIEDQKGFEDFTISFTDFRNLAGCQ